jgi:uncharacterized protein YecT (DUF1311 family)
MKKYFLLLILCFSVPVFADCIADGDDVYCLSARAEALMKQAEAVYQKKLRQLAKQGKELEFTQPRIDSAISHLKKSQSAWHTYVAESCAVEYDTADNSGMALADVACRISEAEKRIAILKLISF